MSIERIVQEIIASKPKEYALGEFVEIIIARLEREKERIELEEYQAKKAAEEAEFCHYIDSIQKKSQHLTKSDLTSYQREVERRAEKLDPEIASSLLKAHQSTLDLLHEVQEFGVAQQNLK
ncbi:MAG: hypothetical protein QNJ34_27455 [Xenococcaceae cyanobacterium MO_188.B29]|nr:hypothetical protein [Xenococcaceae cyanobacterium MO_188.B29]